MTVAMVMLSLCFSAYAKNTHGGVEIFTFALDLATLPQRYSLFHPLNIWLALGEKSLSLL
jgi:hypothetical protein